MNNGQRVDFGRNELWITPQVRQRIGRTRLFLAGCGGNGLLFAAQAAHLGFRRFVLCDPDRLAPTDLNRALIARPADLGRPKVEFLKEYLESLFPGLTVRAFASSFTDVAVRRSARAADIFVGGLDNVISRLELGVLSRSHGKPCVDLGSGFVFDDETGAMRSAGGQVFISRVDGPCLSCLGFAQNTGAHHYYLPESGEPEPSALLLNTMVAALGVDAVLREITNQLAPVTQIQFDRGPFHLSTGVGHSHDDCPVCGTDSAANLRTLGDRGSLGRRN